MWNRRQFIKTQSLAIMPAFIPGMLRSGLLDTYEMKLVRRNVGFFKEKGGTIGWLIQPDGIVVVDSQWKEQAEHLLTEIRNRQDGPVQLLINTHHHGDHTSGNIAFKGIAKHVLAHTNSNQHQRAVAEKNGNVADQLFPDQTYADTWQQNFGDETVEVRYWGPGHTNGDSTIHFHKAEMVHIGDLVFNRKFPYIDRSAGASIENWIVALDKIQSYHSAKTQYIFGHAGEGYDVTGTKDDLHAFRGYLESLLDYVGKKIKSGASKEEILKIKSIPGAASWKGEGIERSLNAAMDELGMNQ